MKGIGRELLSEDALAQLFWDSADKCIEAEAKESGATENYRATMETALRYIKEKRVQKMLADISMLSRISGEDIMWTEADWLPRCWEAGLRYIGGGGAKVHGVLSGAREDGSQCRYRRRWIQ